MNDPIICLKYVAILHILLVDLSMSVFFLFWHLDQTLINICVLNRCIFKFNVRFVVCTLAVSLKYMYMYRRQEEISVILFILSYFTIVYEFHYSNCCFILLLYMYQLGIFFWILLLVDSLNPRTFLRKGMIL